jgi:hypothetical protein
MNLRRARSHRWLVGPLTGLVFGASLVCAGITRAESPPRPCWQSAAVRPGPGGSLPRNAPALVFEPPMGWWDGPIENYALALHDSDGNVVPTAAAFEGDDVLVRPQRALTGGEATLRYRNVCNELNPMGEQRVRIDPESPLPTAVGAVSPTAAVATATNSSCASHTKVKLSVAVELTPEMAAYRDVARWRITYQGQTRLVGYGALSGLSGTPRNVVHFDLEDDCPVGREAVGGSVVVRAHVAGADSDPEPASGTVGARCPTASAVGARPACPVDAGIDQVTGNREDVLPPLVVRDAGTSPDATAQVSRSSSGGCSFAVLPRSPLTKAPTALGLIALGLLLRRRR